MRSNGQIGVARARTFVRMSGSGLDFQPLFAQRRRVCFSIRPEPTHFVGEPYGDEYARADPDRYDDLERSHQHGQRPIGALCHARGSSER